MKKILLLIAIIICSVYGYPASNVKCIQIENSNGYKLSFEETFGNDDTAWILSFNFGKYGGSIDFLVASNYPIPAPTKNNISELKITFTSGSSLTFLCSSTQSMHYTTSINMAILHPSTFDAMNEPISYVQGAYMKVLASNTIKSITLNGMTLPGPYPSASDFKTLFNEGVSKFPGSSFYDPYRKMMQEGTSSSKSQTKKTTTSSNSKQTNKSKTPKPSPQPQSPARPQGFPAAIEIKNIERLSKTESQFNFSYKGVSNKEYTIDLATLPEKLPEIFNIPLSKNVGPSLAYLVSSGDGFYGNYMEKFEWRSKNFTDVSYSTKVYPDYFVRASETFNINGKKNVLYSKEYGNQGTGVDIIFSQNPAGTVINQQIALYLGLKQTSGTFVLFDKSYEKKVCKAVDKYFNNLYKYFKEKGYDIEKRSKTEFEIKIPEGNITYKNNLNGNYSYGRIEIRIYKAL